jgi:hypothetical protein
MTKNKNKYLKKLSKEFREDYIASKINRSVKTFKFGSIYSTIDNKNGKRNIVVLVDLLNDIEVSQNKFVTVCPISDDLIMAAETDLIFLEKDHKPFMFDFIVHCKLQTTIRRKDLNNYLGSFNDNQCDRLLNFLMFIDGSRNADIKNFKSGSKLIRENDYRIKYQQKIAKEMEYLVIPSMSEMSNLLSEYEQEDEKEFLFNFKPKYKIEKFNYLISYLNDNYNIDSNYNQFIKTFNLCSYSKEKEVEIKIIKEYLKKGFNVIREPDHPKGPDLIIENEQGERREIEIKNDMVFEFYKDKYDKCLRSIKYRIEHGKMEEIPNIIYNWERNLIPLTKLKNVYGSTLKWIPEYAVGNVEGLKNNLENLLLLKEKERNHLDVDNSINIINGRTNHLQGKYEKALEFYYGLDIKDFMVRYMLFTDPRIDCHLLIGDKNGAYELASQNPKLINKRAERALKSSDPTLLYASEAIQAGQILSARA